jgi:hypothetical protein
VRCLAAELSIASSVTSWKMEVVARFMGATAIFFIVNRRRTPAPDRVASTGLALSEVHDL